VGFNLLSQQKPTFQKENNMIEVNGREYPLWSQFVERKEEWIGGRLEDFGDSFDNLVGMAKAMPTEITDIILKPNGETSAMFSVEGKDFSCGFDVHSGGVVAGAEGWITFSGYGGHVWRIKQKEKEKK
jgi:hypothetical protein